MLYRELVELYQKFRLIHYKELFGRIREKDGSLSATEAFAVDVIHLLDRPTLSQFAEALNISQPNATYKANNLMAKGYIVKRHSDDKRECRLEMGDKFYQYFDTQNQFMMDAVGELQRQFSPEELSFFEKVLSALIRVVG